MWYFENIRDDRKQQVDKERSLTWEMAKNSRFWKQRMLTAAEKKVDYGEPLPELDEQFLAVWSRHYASIVSFINLVRRCWKLEPVMGSWRLDWQKLQGVTLVSTEHPSRAYFFRPSLSTLS